MSRRRAALLVAVLLTGCGAGDAPAARPAEIATAGVVLQLPEGWSAGDEVPGQGLVTASRQPQRGERPTQFLVAGAAERSALPLEDGAGFEQALAAIRDLRPHAPDREQDVEVDGAGRARLLRFDGVRAEPYAGPSSEVVILAAGVDGGLWVFTYWAPVGEFDEALAADLPQRVAVGAGSDPVPAVTEY